MNTLRMAGVAALLGLSAMTAQAAEKTVDLDRSDVAVRRLTEEVERLRSELEAIRARLVVAEGSVTSFGRQLDSVEQQNAAAIDAARAGNMQALQLVEKKVDENVAALSEKVNGDILKIEEKVKATAAEATSVATASATEAATKAASVAVRDMQGRQAEQSTEITSALAGYRELRERVDKYQASALEQEQRVEGRLGQMAREIEVISGAVTTSRRVSAAPAADTGELNAARLAKFTGAGDDYRVQISYDDATTASRMARFLTANGVSAETQSVDGKSIVSLGQFSDLDAARKQSDRINRRFELATEVVDGKGARL